MRLYFAGGRSAAFPLVQLPETIAWIAALAIFLMLPSLVKAQSNPVRVVSQVGHSDGVTAVAFTPDGRTAISGSKDRTVRIWDVETGRLRHVLSGHASSVRSLDVSPSGRYLASTASGDVIDDGPSNQLLLWNITTGSLVGKFSSDPRVAVFAGVDHILLTAQKNDKGLISGLQLLDIRNGELGPRFIRSSDIYNAVRLKSGDGVITLREPSSLRSTKEVVVYAWTGKRACERTSDRAQEYFADLVKINKTERIKAISDICKILVGLSSKSSAPLLATANKKEYVSFDIIDPSVRNPRMRLSIKRPDVDFERTLNLSALGITSAVSDDGKHLLLGTMDDVDVRSDLYLVNLDAGVITSLPESPTKTIEGVLYLSSSKLIVAGIGSELHIWDSTSGRRIGVGVGHADRITALMGTRDGNILTGGADGTLIEWRLSPLRVISTRLVFTSGVTSMAWLPDSRSIVLSGGDGKNDGSDERLLKILDRDSAAAPRNWRMGDGFLVLVAHSSLFTTRGSVLIEVDWLTGARKFAHHIGIGRVATAIPMSLNRSIVTGHWDNSFVSVQPANEAKPSQVLRGHQGPVVSLAMSNDERSLFTGSQDGKIFVWNLRAGSKVSELTGHTGWVRTLVIGDRGLLWSGGFDGIVKVWDPRLGRELASFQSLGKDSWLSRIPSGYFFGENIQKDAPVHIVDGDKTYSIRQIWDTLYNPDLVREALAGDPNEEVLKASQVINLEGVLQSGPAPSVTITGAVAPQPRGDGTVSVEVTVAGRDGKDVGRIEWRINGVTVGILSRPEGVGPEYIVKRDLALRPGTNDIEVVAYNAANLLASLPAQTSIIYNASDDTAKPRLHVLAVGIDDYRDDRFQALKFARSDADAFARLMDRIGRDVRNYSGVPNIIVLPEAQATREGIEGAIADMTSRSVMHPRDVFIFFAAAHGTSRLGRFYLVPHGFQSANDTLERTAVGQSQLQEWLANKVTAQHVLVLLDTCASGALVSGAERSRVDIPASDAAVGRLHEATGRPILTAAATGMAAAEGYLAADGGRYGVFTYAVLEAFEKGDTNDDGNVDLMELAAHVQRRVPELASSIGAVAVGRAALADSSRSTASPSAKTFTQSPRFGSRGDNFVIGSLNR